MVKQRNQRSAFPVSKATSQERSSTLDHLLFRHRLPPTFPLAKEIREFNAYRKKSKAHVSLDERLESFAKKRNWTGDDRKNFRIMSAIKNGWEQTFGKTTREYLVAQKDEQGTDWVYKYQCRECKSVDQRGITRLLSQYQYDQLPEDEAKRTLLGQEIKKCPRCGEYTQFKKVRARTQSWEMEKLFRKAERIAERKSIKGIPLTDEQVRDLDKALCEFKENVVNKGNKLILNRIPTEREIRDFKPYVAPDQFRAGDNQPV